jgi:hypothetical protein
MARMEIEVSDILNKSGTVTITDPKNSWDLKLTANKVYHFEAQNTGNHGELNFKLKAETLNYSEVPIGDDWNKIHDTVNLDPGESEKGSFTAPRSIFGLSSTDPQTQADIESISYVQASVHWVVTTHTTNYTIRIYE